jgi:hypothetical protein
MMNNHSTRRVVALALVAILAGACGGGSDGAATNKADWEERYAGALSILSDGVDRSQQALAVGQRQELLAVCTQLKEDLEETREALPVPDATVDAALRTAFDAIGKGADNCLEGARVASEAHRVEVAQEDMKAARERLDEAENAIAAWQ